MKYLLPFAFIFACAKIHKVSPSSKEEEAYFSPQLVVAGINALKSISDWPKDTKSLQKELDVSPELAQKLLMPLHPLWDDKVNEVINEMKDWSHETVLKSIGQCEIKCECDFYKSVFERSSNFFKKFPDSNKILSKKETSDRMKNLSCLENSPPLKSLMNYLKKELPKYEAESLY